MKNIKRYLSIVVFAAMLVGLTPAQTLHASSLEEQKQELERQKEENKQKKNQTETEKKKAQDVVDGLQDEANQLGYTYNSLNKQLNNVNAEISNTENAIATTSSDIQKLEKELEEAKKNKDQQYEGMKKRIQYMYENNSTQSLLVSILTSGSVAEMVQRTEYASMIVSYDRDMVQAYEELQTTIVSKSEQLEKKQKELSAYQDTLSEKQDELGDLVDNAGDAYADKKGQVSAAQMTVEEYNAKIEEYRQNEAAYAQQEAQIQAQMAQQYTEQIEAEGGGEEDNSGALSGYSNSDLALMAAIIQAEAGNQGYEGQLAVGTVIMNRVMSNKFPNTISGVVYQNMQFQPVRDGHLALILERGANDSCTAAAQQVLNGYRSGDWLFFMTQKWADYYGITGYTMIGAHAFFRRWGAN